MQFFGGVRLSHLGDLFDERAGDVRVLLARHEKDRFDFGIEGAIGKSHGEFGLDVGQRPHAAQHHARPAVPNEFDGESVKDVHANVFERPEDFASQVKPFFRGEKGALVGIDADPDRELSEDFRAPTNDVEMSERQGVETTDVDGVLWIERSRHGIPLFNDESRKGSASGRRLSQSDPNNQRVWREAAGESTPDTAKLAAVLVEEADTMRSILPFHRTQRPRPKTTGDLIRRNIFFDKSLHRASHGRKSDVLA